MLGDELEGIPDPHLIENRPLPKQRTVLRSRRVKEPVRAREDGSEMLIIGEPPDPGKPEGGPYPLRPDPGKVEDYSLSRDDRRIAMRGFLAVFGPLTLVALGIGWTAHYWAPLQGIAVLLLVLAVIGAWVSLIEWAVSR